MTSTEELREKIPPFAKDLALNLSSVLGDGALDERARWGVALACALATDSKPLRDAIGADAVRIAGDAIVDDARAAAALMAMNNVYYRFRHFLETKESYAQKPARLRMTRIAKPASDKATFELMCLAVSAVNGCETCVRSHEATLAAAGVSEDAVHDAVRIAATIRGVATALA